MGELHLEILVDRMKRESKVEANVGKPQVAYRETITKKVVEETKFVRQAGGKGQYAHVIVKIEPLDDGNSFDLSEIPEQNIDFSNCVMAYVGTAFTGNLPIP